MTVSFKTFGCRLNRAETDAFVASFAAAGVACVPFGEPADIVVFHTCAVTQHAEDECLKLLRSLRKKNPSAFLVMAGCAVESVAAETLAEAGLNLVVTREQKDVLVDVVLRMVAEQRPLSCPPQCCSSGAASPEGIAPASSIAPHGSVSGDAAPERQGLSVVPRPRRRRALLKIQDGCDFFCTYCFVPHARGLPRSRPFDDCLREAKAFADAGHREIVVTGCNIACYEDGGRKLPSLLAALAELPGLGRLRLGSIEPGMVEGEVAALMASTEKICRFLHLPIQSGDDGVLRRMGRHYTSVQIETAIRQAQALMPDAAFGADFICGFPGETEAAFGRTLRLAEALPLSNLHVFPYSERPGTSAAAFDGSVPPAERRDRAKRLIALGRAKRVAFAQRFVGKRIEFVIERFDRDGRACGWSGEYLPCAVGGVPRERMGTLYAFTPERADGETLTADASSV